MLKDIGLKRKNQQSSPADVLTGLLVKRFTLLNMCCLYFLNSKKVTFQISASSYSLL